MAVLDKATRADGEYSFEVVEAAAAQWNKDKVARRLSDRAQADSADFDSEESNTLLGARFASFLQAVVVYLNRSWTFVQHLATPLIVQRVTKKDHAGKQYVDIVKQGEASFTSSLQNHCLQLLTPDAKTGNLCMRPRLVARLWLQSKHRKDKSKIMFDPRETEVGDRYDGAPCAADPGSAMTVPRVPQISRSAMTVTRVPQISRSVHVPFT